METTEQSNANTETVAAAPAPAPAPAPAAAPTSANDFLAQAIANNPALQSAIAERKQKTTDLATLSQQLGGQASGYGFSWKGNKAADYHQMEVAKILYDKGVRSLSDLGYSEDGKNLINKNTGQIVPFYKNRSIGKDGKGQVGWSGAGKGLTNYYVQADAQGNPVFTPKWKSNAPGGIGGFLIKAAPSIVGIATGNPWLAAATSAGLGAVQGQNFGDILKGAAIAGGSTYLGGRANVATQGALKGLDPIVIKALGNAAQGFTQSGVSGAATGNFSLQDALLSGLSTGAATGIQGLLSPKALPAGQAGPPAPGMINTGVGALDRAAPTVIANTARNVIRGQDVGSALTGSALTAAGQETTRQLPDTGYDLVNAALRGGVQIGTDELASALNTRAGSTSVAPSTVAKQSTDLASTYRALLPFLQAARAPEVPQQVAANEFSPLEMQKFFAQTGSYARGGNITTDKSFQQLLALLQSSGKIA